MTMEPAPGGGTGGFVKAHWMAVVVFAVGCFLAVVAAVYVLWWFTGVSQSSGLVPASLGQWTMGNLVAFALNLIFWELVLVGIPVIVGVVLGWLWWKRLPEAERRRWPDFGRGSRRTSGSAGFSLLLFIAFCIKVYLDGNWNAAISSFSLDYVVGSAITILVWFAAILAIPAIAAAAWWFSRKKPRP